MTKKDTGKIVKKITSDNPIQSPKDDTLGRAGIAETFVEHILSLDVSEGVVIGVLGPWGSGKTSFVNLARTYLNTAGVTILNFNPWMFSGAEQLMESFFIELSVQLKLKPEMAEVSRELESYGEFFAGMSWVPVIGPWIDRGRLVTKMFSKLIKKREGGIEGRRAKVAKALNALQDPLVVILDDIDRLSTPEIRDVFKLVRLTANFPNIIYILAFDRLRVEQALGEQGISGRDYLEKILQLGFDLPEVPEPVLDRQVFEAIDSVIENVEEPGHFDQNAWPDVFVEIIKPLIRNMRDVRRYAAALHGTVRSLQGRIALVDILAIEAIRVFLPDVFRGVRKCLDGLTTPGDSGFGGNRASQHLKDQIDQLIESAIDKADIIKALIERLFPAATRHIGGSHYGHEWENSWLLEKRIAHKDILRLYLERIAGEGLLAFNRSEEAWIRMSNHQSFEEYLKSIDIKILPDVISSLEVFEKKYTKEHVVSGCVVLLNLLSTLPTIRRSFFGFDNRTIVGRVVYRLLKSLNDQSLTVKSVDEIIPQLKTLYAKDQIITIIGYRENAGHKLVSEAAAKQFEKQ